MSITDFLVPPLVALGVVAMGYLLFAFFAAPYRMGRVTPPTHAASDPLSRIQIGNVEQLHVHLGGGGSASEDDARVQVAPPPTDQQDDGGED